MKVLETIGYQGGKMFFVVSKIVAFQQRKNVGDSTPSGITNHPQTTVWVQSESEIEEWIVLEDIDVFRNKFEASV